MHTDHLSISQLTGSANRLIASSPETYLVIAALLFFLVIGIPLFLLLKDKTFSGVIGLVPYAVLVGVTSLYYRLPFLVLGELNPDEGQEIAAALTLVSDPVYWRSVDMHTHGPLSTYPLMLPHLFGIQIDYGSSRLIGLSMLLSSVLLIFLILRKWAVNTIAVIAVLPIIAFICMTDYWDFIGYNAEHPVIFAIVLSLYFTQKALVEENRFSSLYLYLAGVVAGSAPFVKVQCLPMVFAIAASTYVTIWFGCDSAKGRIRRAGIYSLGGLTFTAILYLYLLYFGLIDDFVVRFIYGQINYVNGMSHVQKISLFFETYDWVNLSAWYYFDLMIFADIILAGVLIVLKNGWFCPPRRNNLQKEFFSSVDMRQISVYLLVTAMSILSIYIPGRNFRHYFLLLAFPLGLLTGKLFILTYNAIEIKKRKITCAILFLLVTAFGPYCYKYLLSSYNVLLSNNKLTFNLLINNCNIFNNPSKTVHDKVVTDTIKMYTVPGEKMALWGWANKYYVSSNQIIGCRTSTVHLVLNIFGNRSYYFKSYMQELKAANAPVFLDAVESEQFGYFTKKSKYAFEQFPELNKYIQAKYTCMKDIDGMRVFVSKQRLIQIQNKQPLL